jgi:hypothetical protein
MFSLYVWLLLIAHENAQDLPGQGYADVRIYPALLSSTSLAQAKGSNVPAAQIIHSHQA